MLQHLARTGNKPGTPGWARDNDPWQRWDEDIVQELLRWLGRLARVFAIMFLAVFAATSLAWLWSTLYGLLPKCLLP
jgi:hypothetical protein